MANCRTLPEQVLKNTEDIKRLIEQGTIDAADLLTLLTGDETIIVDLAESGQQVEIHLDQHFRQSLATKIDLVGKLNADTVYSNDDPAFADAMEQVTDLNSFYQFFYDRRKEPSKIYLIQGQVGITFDNVLTALGFPAVIGEHKWALQCECLSSEAGGFFIKMTLTTDNHQILYTNTIGGWLSGQTIGKWKDMKKDAGGGGGVSGKKITYTEYKNLLTEPYHKLTICGKQNVCEISNKFMSFTVDTCPFKSSTARITQFIDVTSNGLFIASINTYYDDVYCAYITHDNTLFDHTKINLLGDLEIYQIY